MFRAHRPIFRRVRTVVHTTIGSYSICPFWTRALYVVAVRTNNCVNSCTNSPEDGPVGPKHVQTQPYTNKIVTSVGFHSIHCETETKGSNVIPETCSFSFIPLNDPDILELNVCISQNSGRSKASTFFSYVVRNSDENRPHV